jgi:Flp pilus assembly protein TadG
MARRFSFGRRFGRAEGGVTAVEFALVLPLFIGLLIGIFELSRMMFVTSSVQYSVDRAARLAVIDPTVSLSDIEADILSRLEVSNSPTVDLTITRTTIGVTDVAQVSAHYDHVVTPVFFEPFTVGWDFVTIIPQP